jgi:hypothetical protein
MKEGSKFPWGGVVMLTGMLLCMVYLCAEKRTETKVFKEAKKKQDSLIERRDTVLRQTVRISKENAQRGTNLIKQLPDEKTIVTDTANAAMFEYVAGYRYSE